MNRTAILVATIALTAFAAPSFAQTTAPSPPPVAREDAAGHGAELRVTDLIGQPVYVATGGDGREAIGDISDVLMTPEGRMTMALVGVGGFLGVGERTVALPLDELTITPQANDPSALEIVSKIRPEVLEAMESFTESARTPTSSSAPGEVEPSESAPVTETD